MYRWQKPPILPRAYASAHRSSNRRWRSMERSSVRFSSASLEVSVATAESCFFLGMLEREEMGERSEEDETHSVLSPLSALRSVSHSRRLHLLPGVVARADEGAGFDVTESHPHADLAELAKFLRRHVPVDRNVTVGRPQILAERQNVDVDVSKIAHHELDFLEGLAHAEDDARLGRNLGCESFRGAENLHH